MTFFGVRRVGSGHPVSAQHPPAYTAPTTGRHGARRVLVRSSGTGNASAAAPPKTPSSNTRRPTVSDPVPGDVPDELVDIIWTHITPETSSEDRMHMLWDDCWCHPTIDTLAKTITHKAAVTDARVRGDP